MFEKLPNEVVQQIIGELDYKSFRAIKKALRLDIDWEFLWWEMHMAKSTWWVRHVAKTEGIKFIEK